MQADDYQNEEERLRSTALQNVRAVAVARKKAEAELLEAQSEVRETARRFELALAAGHLGDWSWDAATDVVTLGDSAAAIFELPSQAPITWAAMRELLHAEDRERARLAVERSIETRTDYDIQYRVNKPSGEMVWIAARGRGSYGDDGSVLGMIGVVQDITSSKRAEQALRESEERLRATFAQAAVGIAIAGLDGRFIEMNLKFSEILGFERSDLRNRTFLDITHAADIDATTANMQRLMSGEIPFYAMEKRYVRRDGSTVWSLSTVTMVRDEESNASQFIGVIEDITHRKLTEAALRQSEQFNRTIIESSRDCTKTLALDGTLLWMSDNSLRQLCIDDPSTVIGKSWTDFWHGPHREAAIKAVTAAAQGKAESFVGLFAVEGQERWWDVVVSPIADHEGRPERLLAVSRDVTERILADHALKEESRILELLNQTGAKVASKLDVKDIVQAVTDTATELSGAQFGAFFYTVTDESGDAFMLFTLSGAPREAFEKFGHPRATPLFGPTFRGEGIIRSDDVMKDPRYGQWGPHHGKPKGHLPVRSYLAVPVISRSGETIGGLFLGHPEVAVFTPRTERLVAGVAAQAAIAIDNARLYEAAQKAAERERAARAVVEQVNATKDEFLATLSHELRTPLSAIVGWSQILKRGNQSPDELARAVEVIERNARAQTQLIDDLLDMSRITSGKVRLDIQPVLPFSFIEAAVESLKPAAEAKGVRMEVLLDPVAGPVSGDPGRLQQVVWNLLSNAVKFTPRGGKIQVRLERVNSHVEITVSDTGSGIAPEFLQHVFERFRQADSSTTRRHGGLGLGLSIVKHLVELHGGSVHASSAGIGEGATFRVNLPLTVVHPVEQPRRSHPKYQASASAAEYQRIDLAGVSVVVVDDEPDARELIAKVLAECGAHVTTCASASEALERIAQARPTALVSDIGMPDIDGYELLRRVRDLDADGGARIPAIALTAFARTEDRTKALRAGFAVHVAKPVDPAELIVTVASVAGRVG